MNQQIESPPLLVILLDTSHHLAIWLAIPLFFTVLVPTCYAQSPAPEVSRPASNTIRLAAQKALNEGQQLLAEGTAISQGSAIEKFAEAGRLWRALSDRRMEAISLSYGGKVYDLLGEKQRALDNYDQALSILHAIGDVAGEAITLNNIGLIYDSLGDKQKALAYYDRALPTLRAIGDRRTEAITLVNLGLAYASLGEKQKALEFYNQALPILRAVADRGGEAVTLNNIGYIYVSLGESQKALDYFGQALPILQEVQNTRVAAITLNNIGYVYESTDQKQKALEYYNQALPVLRLIGDRRMEAFTLNNLGLVYLALGERQKALDYFNQALSLRRAVSDRPGEAATLSDIGSFYDSAAQPEKALDYYQQALRLSRTVEDREVEALTLHRIARAERKRGHFVAARADIEATLAIVESLRTKIAGQELRASYFASIQQYFEFCIDLMMQLHRLEPDKGYDAMALQGSERARARSLLEVITQAGANIRQGVDATLLERERSLQQRLNATAERQTRLLNDRQNEDQATTLKKEVASLLTQYQQVEAQIIASSPRYAALAQRVQLSLKEIQDGVLDPETILLEYALGDEKSFVFAVTPNSIKSFELPPRAEIERVARRVYSLLTARNQQIKFETTDEQRLRLAGSDIEYWESAAVLSRMLLGPVASLLAKKRLLIVGDGALDYVPFAALPTPAENVLASRRLSVAQTRTSDHDPRTTDQHRPLILDHEIVTLPSATTLTVLRRELRGRKAAAKTLAVLADPVFEKDDERVKVTKIGQNPDQNQKFIRVRSAAGPQERQVVRSGRQAGKTDDLRRIQRLRYTRQEADEILALVSRADSMRALDFAASRATATSPELGQYRYVHFATHGVLDSAHPELSAIVLSLVNERGVEQDGFLWANEVYNLRLPAEMVVLSGCRTGLGKEIKGEGLMGLTRGFMYAGSARVLVSLWDIADEASAALMARLYKGILGQEKMRPAAALRAAQIDIMRDKRWQAPYYWAAFVLQGEPR